ncbi:hypothetical protein IWQ60_011195 [Tieghemiomyces parasiticus]|uniref:Uncharacterized protein n=1 Tax=Tieghemiomyces parasiticus TaxID=78921 RepID=A0A9W7ZNS9_9FUNG|nr:hypothetical protein IWQ60_011195 [Tieghemiomyces parasiticus]
MLKPEPHEDAAVIPSPTLTPNSKASPSYTTTSTPTPPRTGSANKPSVGYSDGSDVSEDEVFFGPVTTRERQLVGTIDFYRRQTIHVNSPSNNFELDLSPSPNATPTKRTRCDPHPPTGQADSPSSPSKAMDTEGTTPLSPPVLTESSSTASSPTSLSSPLPPHTAGKAPAAIPVDSPDTAWEPALSPESILADDTPIQSASTRTSSRLATVRARVVNGVTGLSPSPSPAGDPTARRPLRGRLNRAAPRRKPLGELTGAELRKITAANTRFNERYERRDLELVVIRKEIPRPLSPSMVVEEEFEEDEDSDLYGVAMSEDGDDDGWVDLPSDANLTHADMAALATIDDATDSSDAMQADSPPAEFVSLGGSDDMQSVSSTTPSSWESGTMLVGLGVEPMVLPNKDDSDEPIAEFQRIRWNSNLVEFDDDPPDGPTSPLPRPVTSAPKSCLRGVPLAPPLFPEVPPSPLDHGVVESSISAADDAVEMDAMAGLTSPSSPETVKIQRILYADDDLDDPDFRDQLIFRNRVYSKAFEADLSQTPDESQASETCITLTPENLTEANHLLLGKPKPKPTKRKKRNR